MLHTDIWPSISNKNTTNGAEIRKWNLKQNLEYEGWKKGAKEIGNVFIMKTWPPFKCRRNRFLSAGPHRADSPHPRMECLRQFKGSLWFILPWTQPANPLAATVEPQHLRGLDPSQQGWPMVYGLTPLLSRGWRFPRPHSVVRNKHWAAWVLWTSHLVSVCLLIWK